MPLLSFRRTINSEWEAWEDDEYVLKNYLEEGLFLEWVLVRITPELELITSSDSLSIDSYLQYTPYNLRERSQHDLDPRVREYLHKRSDLPEVDLIEIKYWG